jgi:3-hydroxyisobutyrate dehydrogenase-like beta-hydroxyacid dehydrogenase
MKLAINLVLMVEVIAFGEAIALAEKGRLAEVAVEAMLNSVAASPVLGYRGPFILEGNMPEVPLADVNLQQRICCSRLGASLALRCLWRRLPMK